MQALALRALAWFTWAHIQWLMVQCLNDKGLYHASYKTVIRLSTKEYPNKTWDSITFADAMKALKPNDP
jgi:hypothetical protein